MVSNGWSAILSEEDLDQKVKNWHDWEDFKIEPE